MSRSFYRDLLPDADEPPADIEILKAIYKRHRKEYEQGRNGRGSDVFVPVDVPAIADELRVSVHSVFGRLHYHLEPKYGEAVTPDGGPRKAFFHRKLGDDTNAVNFPLLEAVLAGLWEERRRDLWTFWASALSVGIAVASLLISILR